MVDRPVSIEADNVHIDRDNRDIVIQPHDSLVNGTEIRINLDEVWLSVLDIIDNTQKLSAFIRDKIKNYKLPDGSQFNLNVSPTLDLVNSTVSLAWTKTFKDDDVILTAEISGTPFVWASNPGSTTFKQFDVNVQFSATKRF